jgi:hypothetical protein
VKILKYAVLFAGLAALLVATDTAVAQNWGTVKGKVVWAGGPAPAPVIINPNKDQAHCGKNGPINSDELVVDKKTLGVQNVMVWLAPVQGKLPIHPALKAVPKEKVVIDQPCCMFVPRITMMRDGQILEVKNPSPVLHNARISGSTQVNGTINLSIPPGQSIEKSPKAEKKPMLLGCDVHGWMGGRIGVFDHPYFALTKADGTFEIKNAPAGKVRIFVQQEKIGWLHKQTGAKLSDGEDITIPAGGTLDMGKIDAK